MIWGSKTSAEKSACHFCFLCSALAREEGVRVLLVTEDEGANFEARAILVYADHLSHG